MSFWRSAMLFARKSLFFTLVFFPGACFQARAQDAAILRRNMWEAGGFAGASYGIGSAHFMGGGNLTYSVTRSILPYVEASYLSSVGTTVNAFDESIPLDFPITDVNFGVHIRARIPRTRIVPYAVVGYGLLHTPDRTINVTLHHLQGTVPKEFPSSTDGTANFGGGARVYLKEQLGMRFEFKGYRLTGGVLHENGYNWVYRATFGLFWQFGRS